MSFKSQTLIVSLMMGTSVFAAPKSADKPTAPALPEIVTLKEARPALVAPEYTAAERQLVADQAYFLINNAYVHREIKLKDFGPSADAVARLKNMRTNAARMKDDEFQTAMQLIFRDLHDHHTNYSAPVPLGCSYALSPMSFRDVVEDGKVKIIFQRLSRIATKIPGEHQNAAPLDELVAIDGKPAKEFMKDIMDNSMGATNAAQIVYGLMTHTVRNLAALPVPENDTITYTLKNTAGKTYDIKANYYAIVNEPNCVAEVKKQLSETLPVRPRFVGEEDRIVKDYKKFAEPEVIAPFDNDPLSEIARIQDVDSPVGKIMFLKIASFMPMASSTDTIIQRVREELIARREASAALVIDIRQNGGGSIKLAEELTQLFTPADIQTMPVRLIPTELNRSLFLESNGGAQNGWTQDISDALTKHESLTKPRLLTSHNEANRIGQIWFKPVVVLTDAACYSACDLFAASMQDHGAATIVGSHPSTGAGGANVMEVRSFQAILSGLGASNPFKNLPDGQSMRVSWRQTVRVGKNAGQLIEDRGVIPDVVINYTRKDLDEKTPSQAFLSGVLGEVKKLIPKFKGSIALASSLRMDNGAAANWKERVSGVDSLEVVLAEKVIKTISVKADMEVEILLDEKGTWESKHFDVVGKLDGKTQFRVVRDVFWRGDEIKIGTEDLDLDLSDTASTVIKTFVVQGKAADEWQTSDGILRVGKGPKYNSNVVTEAFLPLDLSEVKDPVIFYLNAAIQSEDGMDVLSVIERDTETGEERYLMSLDGTIDMKNRLAGFKINPDKKHVEMVLKFESDENWNMIGPIVRKIGVHVGAIPQPKPRILSLFGL